MSTLETFMVYWRVVHRVIVVYRPIRAQITFMIRFFSTADTFITVFNANLQYLWKFARKMKVFFIHIQTQIQKYIYSKYISMHKHIRHVSNF